MSSCQALHLNNCKHSCLVPGVSFFFQGVQFTKQKGFGEFNLAGYYPRKYRGKVESSGWYLLTNLSNLDTAIIAFKRRSGIEAMFKGDWGLGTGYWVLGRVEGADGIERPQNSHRN